MVGKKPQLAKKTASAQQSPKKYLSQTDVPAFPLSAALRVSKAICDNYGKNPTKPLRVAQAMDLSPGSSGFRMLCGASIAYGLTDGGYNSEQISITSLGRRIVAPTSEGDDFAAMREALLMPRVNKEFLKKYNGSKLPPVAIAKNVLGEMGVPDDRAADVFAQIIDGAKSIGFIREVRGQNYVDLDVLASAEEAGFQQNVEGVDGNSGIERQALPKEEPKEGEVKQPIANKPNDSVNRVFITHGRNKEIVTQLKDLLTFGGFTPVVAAEHETASKPVPEKVMDDMRSCGAAIIHVGTEMRVVDAEGKEHRVLNQNVLIEIGAAMALYGRKFILLVENGSTLPSNLQGLYEVRYEGAKLDYESTMKLLKAFNDFRV